MNRLTLKWYKRLVDLRSVCEERRRKFNSFAFIVLCVFGWIFFSSCFSRSHFFSWLIDFASVLCRERRQLMHHKSTLLFFSLLLSSPHPFLSYAMAPGIRWSNFPLFSLSLSFFLSHMSYRFDFSREWGRKKGRGCNCILCHTFEEISLLSSLQVSAILLLLALLSLSLSLSSMTLSSEIFPHPKWLFIKCQCSFTIAFKVFFCVFMRDMPVRLTGHLHSLSLSLSLNFLMASSV